MRFNEDVQSLAVLRSFHLGENVSGDNRRITRVKVAYSSVEKSPERGVGQVHVIIIEIRSSFALVVLVCCRVLE